MEVGDDSGYRRELLKSRAVTTHRNDFERAGAPQRTGDDLDKGDALDLDKGFVLAHAGRATAGQNRAREVHQVGLGVAKLGWRP
jgi:hypothetical protein